MSSVLLVPWKRACKNWATVRLEVGLPLLANGYKRASSLGGSAFDKSVPGKRGKALKIRSFAP